MPLMKYSLMILGLALSSSSWAQSFYASVSGGSQIVQQPDQPFSTVVHAHHTIQMPWFLTPQDLKFKNVSNIDFSLGHALNSNLGYEISFGYLKPCDMVIGVNLNLVQHRIRIYNEFLRFFQCPFIQKIKDDIFVLRQSTTRPDNFHLESELRKLFCHSLHCFIMRNSITVLCLLQTLQCFGFRFFRKFVPPIVII